MNSHKIPCKNCITLPICMIKIKENQEYYSDIRKSYLLTEDEEWRATVRYVSITYGCALLQKYLHECDDSVYKSLKPYLRS